MAECRGRRCTNNERKIKENITVECICPVMFNTEMLHSSGYIILELDTRLKHFHLVAIYSFAKTTLKADAKKLIK